MTKDILTNDEVDAIESNFRHDEVISVIDAIRLLASHRAQAARIEIDGKAITELHDHIDRLAVLRDERAAEIKRLQEECIGLCFHHPGKPAASFNVEDRR